MSCIAMKWADLRADGVNGHDVGWLRQAAAWASTWNRGAARGVGRVAGRIFRATRRLSETCTAS